MLHSFFDKIFEEVIFLILLVLLAVSMFFRLPSFKAIDWRVIAALWNLMAVAVALEDQRFLDWIANQISQRFHNERALGVSLCLTSMGLSMFMTNDVALLTLVPITLLIGKRGGFNPFKLVALETVAANVGSSLTPFGNPQNIFLFNEFHLSPFAFMKITIVFVAVATCGLYLTTLTCPTTKIEFQLDAVQIKSKKELAVFLGLFVIAILSILHVLPWTIITVFILLVMVLLKRHLLFDIDYFLLGTFVLFFLLVDNILSVPGLQAYVSGYLGNPLQVMWSSAIMSQVISNVPSAILLAPFVSEVKPLLIGVSLGGMGTLIASLANLISWKLYIRDYPKQIYFNYFTKINVILLIVVGLIMSLLMS